VAYRIPPDPEEFGRQVGELMSHVGKLQTESYEDPQEGAKRDLIGGIGSAIAGIPTALATPVQQVPAAGRLVAFGDALWDMMSPAGKLISVAGIPETGVGKAIGGLAALPMAFTRRGSGPGMGAGALTDVSRSIMKTDTKPVRTKAKVDPASDTKGLDEGDFRPFHAGSYETALDRILALLHRGGTPTVTNYSIPVKGTLGTFDKPLPDPGSDWVKSAKDRDALTDLGIDAVLYRNTAENAGDVSLEALVDMYPKATKQFTPVAGEAPNAIRSALRVAEAELRAALSKGRHGPTQLTLPGISELAERQSTYSAPNMQPYEAFDELNLWEFVDGGMPDKRTDFSWRDFMQAANNRYHGYTPAVDNPAVAEKARKMIADKPAFQPAKAHKPGTYKGLNQQEYHEATSPEFMEKAFETMSVMKGTVDPIDVYNTTKKLRTGKYTIDDLKTLYPAKHKETPDSSTVTDFLMNVPKGASAERPEYLQANAEWASEVFGGNGVEGVDTMLQMIANNPESISALPSRVRALLDGQLHRLANISAETGFGTPSTNSFMSLPGWANNWHVNEGFFNTIKNSNPYSKEWAEAVRNSLSPKHPYNKILDALTL
jgi:hypothetical protein